MYQKKKRVKKKGASTKEKKEKRGVSKTEEGSFYIKYLNPRKSNKLTSQHNKKCNVELQ